MNLINIVKNIRNMKIIMDQSLLKAPVRKFELKHVKDALIDVDSDVGMDKIPKNLKFNSKAVSKKEDALFYFSKE